MTAQYRSPGPIDPPPMHSAGATYWVLIADELMQSQPDWASAGLEPVEQGGYDSPGMRWHKFRDENADPSLEGKQVELTIGTRDGRPYIMSRRPVA